ncbi:hypothetical protein NW768_004057 [Fusarium equiseti]|uniref:Uncharacterized protein n=1 Tax=Fusarium equiseti TaxID=61235 RepID=A0ABQ8RJG1_FUSEQ|nr:hypothetical protein NW768_004057 [Fusarium equiseti]
MGKIVDTRGRLEDPKDQPRDETQMLPRVQQEKDTRTHDPQELKLQNRELRNTIDYLRGELLSATNEIQEHVDRLRDMESSERKLKDTVENKRKCIEKLNREKNNLETILESSERDLRVVVKKQDDGIKQLLRERVAATMRIKELERSQSGESGAKRSNTTPADSEAKRQKREQNLEAMKKAAAGQGVVLPPRPPPVPPTVIMKVEDEQNDSYMTSDDEEQSVPGLPLVEYGLNRNIIEQLTEIMKTPKSKRRLESFLEHGERDKYFCAHKVLRKGKSISTPLLPKQACPSQNCKHNFRVMVKDTTSGVKLHTAPYTPMV